MIKVVVVVLVTRKMGFIDESGEATDYEKIEEDLLIGSKGNIQNI